MNTDNRKTFAVLFSVDPENTREAARFVLMRRFLEHGLGPDVTVLDEAVFPDYTRVGFVVLAEANDRGLVEAAVAPCAGVFTTSVKEVTLESFDPQVARPRYALFAVSTPNGFPPAPSPFYAAFASAEARARLHVTFPEGGPFSALWLVDAHSFAAAKAFGERSGRGGVVEAAYAQPLQDLFNAKMAAPVSDEPAKEQAHELAGASATFGIENEGAVDAVYIGSVRVAPFTAMQVQSVKARQKATSSAVTYIWASIPGQITFHVHYTNANTFHGEWEYFYPSYWSYPRLVIPGAAGANYAFSVHQDVEFHAKTPLSVWLNDLMSTTKYAAPWPEDSYAGGQLEAYNYIVSQIPGNTPPKKGTLKEPTVIEVIEYPAGARFSPADFDSVKKHLLLEIDCFVTADRWFGPNGIINAINGRTAIISTNDLIEAAELMSIPPATSNLMIILDNVFGEIMRIVAIIPVIGGAIAAVLNAGWIAAKLSMLPGQPDQAIPTTIANIADELNQYLDYMTNSAQTQLSQLYANWGLLNEFSNGVIEGIISVDLFYPPGTAPASLEHDTPPPLPNDYLTAVADAWLIIVYKQLFATNHQVQAGINLSQMPSNNPWNPDAGQYAFTWSLPCTYWGSKTPVQPGFINFDCATDAPLPVLQQFFGSQSRLHVNPVEFFGGFNGWPAVVPRYDAGYQGTSMARPTVPVQDVGLKIWSQGQD
jgi:hypothetical protein